MGKPELDIGTAFSDTFALIRQRPIWILIWGALLFLVPVLPAIPFYVWMASNVSLWMNDPEALNHAGGISMLANLSSILQVVLLIPVIAAVIRFVLGKSSVSSFVGLRLSMDELWVFVTCIALYVGMMIVFMVVMMIAIVFGVLIAAAGNEIAGVVTGILIGLLLLLPCIWLGIRFSLLLPASVDLNNFALSEAWEASKGRFWPLFGTWFLTVLASIGLSIVSLIVFAIVAVIALVIGGLTGMSSFGTDPETWNWLPIVVIGGVLAIVPMMWLSGAAYAVYIGPFASAWRQLKPVPVVVPQMPEQQEI